jgi:hypothetical protein
MLRYRPVLNVLHYSSNLTDKSPDQFDEVREQQRILFDKLLLFVGHHSILAWGSDGEAWESDRLSWEGITNLRIEARIEGAILHGEGWDLRTDKDLPFALDLNTGKRT